MRIPALGRAVAAVRAPRTRRQGEDLRRPRNRSRRRDRARSPGGGPTPRAGRAGRARHLPAGTALRALGRNLAHLQRRLGEPGLGDEERRELAQSVVALQGSLAEHQALRSRMGAVILG